MVIILDITENTSVMEETSSPSLKNEPKNCSFRMEKSLAVVLARNFSGTTYKLVDASEMVGNFNFSASPSVSLMKHITRTQGEVDEITAEMGAIMPYVPKISEGYHSNEGLHAFLSNTLRTEMKRYVSELKYSTAMEASSKIPKDVINVAPLSSFKIPDGSQNHEQMYSELSVHKRRVPTTSLGERAFSFTFPRQFVCDDKQVDDLIVNEMGRQYTFSERLEGWKIERRQRINGRFDLYYYHMRSQTTYRSIVEVLNFLLHESRRDRQKSTGKEKADEADANSKSEVAVKRKRCLSDADSSRKLKKKKVEDSGVESEVEFCRESRENLSFITNPSRVYESRSEFYKLSAEERREEVEKFLRDSYNNMGKSKYFSNREEELMSEEDDVIDEDEKHDYHVSPRQEEKEELPKNESESPVEKRAETDKEIDDETVSEIKVEEEGRKQDDPVTEKKEMAIVGEENSLAAVADADADAGSLAVADIDEASVGIEKTPVRDTFMMGGSSSYFPPYSFDDYDLIYSSAPPHDLMDAHSFMASYQRKGGGL